MPLLDLDPDQLLSTTRAVRKRLDLTHPVELELIRECAALIPVAYSIGTNFQPDPRKPLDQVLHLNEW